MARNNTFHTQPATSISTEGKCDMTSTGTALNPWSKRNFKQIIAKLKQIHFVDTGQVRQTQFICVEDENCKQAKCEHRSPSITFQKPNDKTELDSDCEHYPKATDRDSCVWTKFNLESCYIYTHVKFYSKTNRSAWERSDVTWGCNCCETLSQITLTKYW